MDSMKEQALKIDKYEKEVLKYKEKTHELEYYKLRVDVSLWLRHSKLLAQNTVSLLSTSETHTL